MRCQILPDSVRLDGSGGACVENISPAPVSDIELAGAKNTYLSFQLALSGVCAPLDAISFEFKPRDEAFGQLRFEAYYEWYHHCAGKLIPDMLIPWALGERLPIGAMAAKHYESEHHAFWFDCFLPKTLATGVCEGALDIKWGDERASVPVRVDVKNVTLADESLLIADLNNYADNISNLFPALGANDKRFEDGSYFAAERAFYRMAHEHRAVFHLLPYTHSGFVYKSFAPETNGQGAHIRVTDWSLFDEHFAPYFDGSAFEGSSRGAIPVPHAYLPFCFDWPASYEKFEYPGYRLENRRVLLDFIRHFEEKGWTRTVFELFMNHKKRYRFYPYDGDEQRHAHDGELITRLGDTFADLLDLSDVKILLRTDASWSYGEQYDGAASDVFKMWAVNNGILQFYPQSYTRMKAKGNILWSYGEMPSMEDDLTRLYEYPMRCLANEWGGFLFWNTTGAGGDFLNCPRRNGRETLFYPAYPFAGEAGVFPSLRLKYLRNAMQTADMIKMYEGTWTYHDMRNAINDIYGVSADKWYSPLPDALNVPPHEITNEKLGSALEAANHPGKRLSPLLPAVVSEKILGMACAFAGGVGANNIV